ARRRGLRSTGRLEYRPLWFVQHDPCGLGGAGAAPARLLRAAGRIGPARLRHCDPNRRVYSPYRPHRAPGWTTGAHPDCANCQLRSRSGLLRTREALPVPAMNYVNHASWLRQQQAEAARRIRAGEGREAELCLWLADVSAELKLLEQERFQQNQRDPAAIY